MSKRGNTRGKRQGKKRKFDTKTQIIQTESNLPDNISHSLAGTADAQSQNISEANILRQQETIFAPPNSSVFSDVRDFFGRITWHSISLFALCLIGTIVVYFATPPIVVFTLISSLTFAGFLTFISTFLNQQRFHYRFLLMNESVSRFVAVLASFLLARIIKFGEISDSIQIIIIFPFVVFFILAIFFYSVSVALTNKLKEYLSDGQRHTCVQKTKDYNGVAVPQTEGIYHKLCARLEDENWSEFRKDLDSITNKNIQVFLIFYFIIILLLIYIQYSVAPVRIPNIPPVQ
jgi:hypothetical protein